MSEIARFVRLLAIVRKILEFAGELPQGILAGIGAVAIAAVG